MSLPFNKNLEAIAAKFAQEIIQALRGASIDDLVGLSGGVAPAARPGRAAPAPTVGGRLGRRSVDQIHKTLEQIVTLLGNHPEGLRAEQIRTSLGLDVREMPRPIAEGLSAGVLTKSGQKRATTYTVGSRGPTTASKKKTKRKVGARA